MNPEEVVINILANDKTGSVFESVISKLESLKNVSASVQSKLSNINNGSSKNSQITQLSYDFNQVRSKIYSAQKALNEFNNTSKNITPPNFQLNGSSYNPSNFTLRGEGTRQEAVGKGELIPLTKTNALLDLSKEKTLDFNKATKDAGKSSYSSFHQLNNMLLVVGNSINNIGTKIAGVFGAAGMTGMIEKMWQGAAQRQQNMMYLMHQKGAEEANKYYDEIMDIVTQLPGDDTFLTNILNMSSALDKSLKLDNLKEAGTAITDYYMAATMKGENSYETQKDIRKYITTGDTRGMRNSVLASEIDLLKNKNSVLERTQALEKALEKTGFSGMSQYESALNQWEEFKGHFQKAFADLGGLVLTVTQPLMEFYNTLDTVFGSRVSQMIIVFATILVGLLTAVGGGLIMLSSGFRIFETITLGIEALGFALGSLNAEQGFFNTLMMMSMSLEQRELYLKGELTIATWSETTASIKNAIARMLGIEVMEGEVITKSALIGATLELVKSKLLLLSGTIHWIRITISDIFWEWRNTDATLSNAISKQINAAAEQSNTIATIKNTLSKLANTAKTIIQVGVTLLYTIYIMLSTGATFGDASAQVVDAESKLINTEVTYGLIGALEGLWAALGPIGWIIIGISVAIMALIPLAKLLGEIFGGFDDVGGMFGAIGDGINRIWNAFTHSEIIQGIIQYFRDFIDTIKEVIGSIMGMFGALFGFANSGEFDIVQFIIDIFHKLGEVVKWVWNILDDFSNSPFGLITWINPLGIILFHLDEIGSFFEDIRDAINSFMGSAEFQELAQEFGEAIDALKEPFQEIWSLIQEIISIFSEAFQDPVGQGTEERINVLVEVLKGLAFILRVTVIPAIKTLAFVIKVLLTPIKVVLTVIRAVASAIAWATQGVNIFAIAWEVLTAPLRVVQSVLSGIWKVVIAVSDAIKNSIIGKLLGWDKENNEEDNGDKINGARNNLYDSMSKSVGSSDMNLVQKHQILGELQNQKLTNGNVNDVRNLGSTYNHNNNQRQIVVNNNFSEGSMPIDARNMTKKEARKMFIGAFGYRRAVGYNGILR